MSDQETAILIAGLIIAFAAMICLQYKRWTLFIFVMFIAAMYYIFIAVYDTEEPRELNSTILDQQREKWRGKEGEPVDGSRD